MRVVIRVWSLEGELRNLPILSLIFSVCPVYLQNLPNFFFPGSIPGRGIVHTIYHIIQIIYMLLFVFCFSQSSRIPRGRVYSRRCRCGPPC